MRCGVRVVTKIHHCGGAARAYSRAIADFRFFDPIFRLWATFTRPFWSQHILVLKYAAPRPQAAARTLQLVINTITTIISTIIYILITVLKCLYIVAGTSLSLTQRHCAQDRLSTPPPHTPRSPRVSRSIPV